MKTPENNLRRAAEMGDLKRLRALSLDPQCNAKLQDDTGTTALILAACGGHATCIQVLLPISNALAQDQDGLNALMHASIQGDTACLQLLLPASDALAKDIGDWTALIWAAYTGHTSCVQILLPVSDTLAKNIDGQTAADMALAHGQVALGNLINAYTLAISERASLNSFTTTELPFKPGSHRI